MMFSHYLKNEKLSDEELENLQKLLLESKKEK